MGTKSYYPIIVISDLHLDTVHSKETELIDSLSPVRCDALVMKGDIIDGWHLLKGAWKKEHTDLLKVIMSMMEKQNTQMVYIRGNHDDLSITIQLCKFLYCE